MFSEPGFSLLVSMSLIAVSQSMSFAPALGLQSGASIRDYALSFETYGTLNADKSNAVRIGPGNTAWTRSGPSSVS